MCTERSVSGKHILVRKRDKSNRPVNKLNNLDHYTHYMHFKMDSLQSLWSLLPKNDFICKLGLRLKETYVSLALSEEDRK